MEIRDGRRQTFRHWAFRHWAFRHEAALQDLYPDPEKKWKPRFSRFLLDSDARFDDFLFHAGRWLREGYERFSTFMDRFHVAGWRRWLAELTVGGSDAGHRRHAPDAGARAAGVPDDVGRRLAEEVGPRGHVPRPLRQRDRAPRHPAQRLVPARRVPGLADQGGARDRGPSLLRAFRHRRRRAPCGRS